jgi:transposase
MQVIDPRCAGLDVSQKTMVVTVMITQDDGAVQREQGTFSTMTADLLTLDDWLRQHQIEVIVLESTGVYWRPVYTVLEEGRTVILVNARHMKAVPGRKTDLKDGEWIADLLRHGLLQASFIPPRPIREIRELTRYRKTLDRCIPSNHPLAPGSSIGVNVRRVRSLKVSLPSYLAYSFRSPI